VHKDRHLLPISLTVSKLSGIGEDTLMLALMQVCSSTGSLPRFLLRHMFHSGALRLWMMMQRGCGAFFSPCLSSPLLCYLTTLTLSIHPL
jgi:hypothetical protein